jgi:hypothetical protein
MKVYKRKSAQTWKKFRETILSEILQYFGSKIESEKYLDKKSSYYACNLKTQW